jgi:hypothetical protein
MSSETKTPYPKQKTFKLSTRNNIIDYFNGPPPQIVITLDKIYTAAVAATVL